MSTEWFLKHAGSDVGQGIDDPRLLLLGIDKPDWVNVPSETGYGGRYRCLEVVVGPCPLQGHGEQCRHYILDGPVSCAECAVSGQFIWYRRRHGEQSSPP